MFFTVDFRHPDDAVLAKMDAALRKGVADIANGIGLETELEQIFYYAPVAFDEACVEPSARSGRDSLRLSASQYGVRCGTRCLLSVASRATSMVFVPCVDGISHNEIEDATFEWIEAGANVLLHAMNARDGSMSPDVGRRWLPAWLPNLVRRDPGRGHYERAA